MHTVYYTGEFVPVERSVRSLDGVTDIWLRRNPRESGNGMNAADEIYLQFPIDEAPSFEELTENIDKYFEDDAAPKPTIESLSQLMQIVLGVK